MSCYFEPPTRRPMVVFFLLGCFMTQCGFGFLSELKNEKGNEFYKKGQVGKAKSEYLEAMKSDPKSPEIAYNLGNALYKESSFKESLNAYQKAAAVIPSSSGRRGSPEGPTANFKAKASYNLGNSLYRNQDLPKAAESYKQALRLNPRDEDAKYNLELLLKKMSENKNQQKDQEKQNQQKDQEKQNQQKDQEQQDLQKQDQQKKQGQGGNAGSSHSQGQAEEQKDEPDHAQEMNGQPGEEKEKEEISGSGQSQPKTAADIRAEQLLNALENQEQQVLKFQNSQENPRGRVKQVAEKDW